MTMMINHALTPLMNMIFSYSKKGTSTAIMASALAVSSAPAAATAAWACVKIKINLPFQNQFRSQSYTLVTMGLSDPCEISLKLYRLFSSPFQSTFVLSSFHQTMLSSLPPFQSSYLQALNSLFRQLINHIISTHFSKSSLCSSSIEVLHSMSLLRLKV